MRSFLHKIAKAALSQAIFVTHGKIATHLVKRDLQYQFGIPVSSGRGQCQSVCNKTDDQYQENPFSFHAAPPFVSENLVIG